jgi:serine/threonine protein phosphatase PrpC
MEDAHIATNLSDIKSQLFAILDGHGGIPIKT